MNEAINSCIFHLYRDTQDEMSMHLIVQEVPEQPKSLRINSQQSRGLQLTWSQPFAGNSPIEEYIIQYKSMADTWQQAERISVPGTQSVINISNLHPATTYHVRMAAENKLGTSELSEIVQVTTLEEVPSAAPKNVRGEAKSSTELLLVWEAPDKHEWNGNLLGYYVGYQMTSPGSEIGPTQGFHFKTVEISSHFGGETTLDKLNKFTQYSIVVQAYTSQGSGPPSKQIHLSTLEDGKCIWLFMKSFCITSTLLALFGHNHVYIRIFSRNAVPSSPPENPKCNVLSSTSIYVTWSPPPAESQNGKLRGYKVAYLAYDDIYDTDPQTVKSNNQYLTIDNLRKFTNYSVWVLAYTKVGDGVKSKQMSCQTHEDGLLSHPKREIDYSLF